MLAFNDVHIAFTLEAAGDRTRLAEQAKSLTRYITTGTENPRLTAALGQPLSQSLHAFRQGDFARTVALMNPVHTRLHEIGGSHAQRDLFIQTLIIAAFRSGQDDLAQQFLTERQAQKSGTARAFAPYLAK